MAYNNFTLESVASEFGLKIINQEFCESLLNVEPDSEFLVNFSKLLNIGRVARTEKAKSELLVTPILVEAINLVDWGIQFFSGEEFNVDPQRGLNGFCDFLLSKSENPYLIEAPVLMLVEAKRGEIDSGFGQCVAEMIAAQSFNQNKSQIIPIIYGCVTSGNLWRFLKLEGSNVTIDPTDYLITPVQKILGILKWMLSQ